MLERKGIPYTRTDLPSQTQKLVLPLLGYARRTVPVLRLEERRVQGTIAIARALDTLTPEPPLLPAGPGRAEIEAAEAWADETLQNVTRRLSQWAAKHQPAAMGTIVDRPLLGLPRPVLLRLLPLLGPVVFATIRVTDADAQTRLAALPGHLERVDAWIERGVLGGDSPNVADFQVAACVRQLLWFDDLRPFVEQRPAGALALRLAPRFPGRFRPVFPAEWLEPLRP